MNLKCNRVPVIFRSLTPMVATAASNANGGYMKLKKLLFASLLVGLTATTAHPAPKDSFNEWLEDYGAWDKVEETLSAREGDTPKDQLDRARVYLKTGSPSQALQIVEMLPSSEDNSTEAERLWYGGKAHRALGQADKAVLWFSRSMDVEPDKGEAKDRFRAEPGLKPLWRDVWRKLFWTARSNFSLSRQSSLDVLGMLLEHGDAMDSDSFWKDARSAWQVETGKAALPVDRVSEKEDYVPFVSANATRAVITTLADTSLARFDNALSSINELDRPALKTFWQAFVEYIQSGTAPQNVGPLKEGGFLKARAFWSGNVPSQLGGEKSIWMVGDPRSAPWLKFRDKILDMDYARAQKALDQEKGSLLISEQMAALIDNLSLALALANGDMKLAEALWNSVDRQKLPVSLKAAGMLAFHTPIAKTVSDNPPRAAAEYPVITGLVAAGSERSPANGEAPFWISLSPNSLEDAAESDWPLDRLIVLAAWQMELNKEPQESLARRAATLFNGTDFGRSALLYLADRAIDAKDLQLAAFYLNRMNTESLSSEFRAKRLDARTRLELEAGKQEQAWETFRKLIKTGEPIQPITRLRVSLMLQQQRRFQEAETQLAGLWAEKDAYPREFQAEILFWLGEGRQAMRDKSKALDYYLRLAWQYPEQSIWSLTAMYRAAMIYESRGNYDTARKLLKTVAKNADRKEQREAAKARLSAIDKKDGGKSSDDALQYPF